MDSNKRDLGFDRTHHSIFDEQNIEEIKCWLTTTQLWTFDSKIAQAISHWAIHYHIEAILIDAVWNIKTALRDSNIPQANELLEQFWQHIDLKISEQLAK